MRLNEVTRKKLSTKITEFLNNAGIYDYTINDDGSIDVDEDVEIFDDEITVLPVKFNVVKGSFNLSGCASLKSLRNSPRKVGESFNIDNCGLISNLVGGPDDVYSIQIFHNDNLRSLKGFPKNVDLDIEITDQALLRSLEGLPAEANRSFTLIDVGITSLKFCPSYIGFDFHIEQCEHIQNLDYLPTDVRGTLNFNGLNPAIKNYLAFFKIKNLRGFDSGDAKLDDILERHYKDNRNVIECQEELIEAGFKEYARLK